MRLLETVAGSMAVALLNARSFEAERQRAAELALINTVQQALAGELSLQGVYDAVGTKLREVFPDGVAYVNGRTDTDRPWSRATICALLASYLTPTAALPALSDEGAVAALGERLAGKRVLLVLDHIDGTGTDFVRWLLGQLTPQSALLFTAQSAGDGAAAATLPQMPGLLVVPLPASLAPPEAAALLADSPLASEASPVLELTGGSLLAVGMWLERQLKSQGSD